MSWNTFWYGPERAKRIKKQQTDSDIADALEYLEQSASPEQIIAAAVVALTRVSLVTASGYDAIRCTDARNVLEDLVKKGLKRRKPNAKRNRSAQTSAQTGA